MYKGEDHASSFKRILKRILCDGEQGSNNGVREYKYVNNVFEVRSFLGLVDY